MLIDENVNILLLQETHTDDIWQLTTRGNISDFKLIPKINHPTHGIATYAGERLLNGEVINNDSTNNNSTVTIGVNNPTITTHNQPPYYIFGRLQQPPHLLDYNIVDNNYQDLQTWAEANIISLIFDSKQPALFH